MMWARRWRRKALKQPGRKVGMAGRIGEAAPKFLAAHAAADAVQLLRKAPLLHDDSQDQDETSPDWRMWLRAARISGVD